MERNPWDVFVGDGYGAALRTALQLLTLVPADRIEAGIRDIDLATAAGPLIDPSAWLSGERFDNADEYVAVLRATLALRRLLPDSITEEDR